MNQEIRTPPDLEQYARDQIRDYIARKFKGHELARLVGAMLEVQGYKVQISPKGPDGGVDIFAGNGPMGFDIPWLVVQVKSGDAPVNVKVVREVQGVMENFGAARGLLVSSLNSGFGTLMIWLKLCWLITKSFRMRLRLNFF